VGMTITAAPLTTVVMGAVGERHAGTASGVNNAVARIAGTLAVALLGTLAIGIFGPSLEARLDALRLPPAVHAALMAQVPRLVDAQVHQVDEPTRRLLEQAIAEAFLHTFRIVMLVCAALALASALCAALTPGAPRRPRASSNNHA